MKAFVILLAATLSTTPKPAPAPQAANTPLQTVLDQMDKASVGFQNATADVHQEVWLKVIHGVDTVQDGHIYVERTGGGVAMGATLANQGATTPPQVIEYKAGVLRSFNPGPDTEDVVKTSAGTADTYLTLGFGGSGKDLQRSWNINDQGSETIGGVKTEKLDLTPKDPNVKGVSHVTMWIDPTRAVAMKQVIYLSGGDYRTAVYTNIKVNGKIDKAKFAIKTDKATKVNVH